MSSMLELTSKETLRQKNTLDLIASENFASPKTLALLGSLWSNKYGEGYPGKRYYAGNQNTDELETFVQNLALKTFDTTEEYGVNLQVLSGSPANGIAYMALLEPGDTIMSLALEQGGHLSHLHKTSVYNKFFNFVNYNLEQIAENDFQIDKKNFIEQLEKHKPKLTILGFSAYPKQFNFPQLIKIAHDYGSLVLADIAHISGLVATSKHTTPFGVNDLGADIITTTTHKTLRGPRGAMIFAKKQHMGKLNQAIFPGSQGGPHFNKIAAVGQSLLEVQNLENYPDNRKFSDYIQNVLDNTKTLENTLIRNGIEIISPTETHLLLVKLPHETDSLALQNILESVGIITNRNPIPRDTKPPWRPSGLRLGGAALTTRCLEQNDFILLGNIISDIIKNPLSAKTHQKDIQNLINKQNWFYN